MRLYSSPSSSGHDPGILNQPSGGSAHYYSEVAQRYLAIEAGVADAGLGSPVAPEDHGFHPILAVHDSALVRTVRTAIDRSIAEGDNEAADPDRVIIPETFAIGARTVNSSRESTSIWADLGAYSFDTSSPIFAGTFQAAYGAAQAAVCAAGAIAAGEALAVALVRPPGHHAMTSAFGGFCYFNNAAIAAESLRKQGRRVATIDVDVHHGNGAQEIFWNQPDVLTTSIHMDPTYEYPFFWGFANETGGADAPEGNVNVPLPIGVDDTEYLDALDGVLKRVRSFGPDALVIALGVDTYRDDPLGRFDLTGSAYGRIAAQIASLDVPTVVTMEGGYDLNSLGANVATFLLGLGD